ncbi:TetR family transcriptional regulator [Salsipaludibacter albus]|uniref:TetR family transcriptional regulator n=1 Tax=Salsipaludibacter albus TaxID=2849650 RepID=UPI001EE4CF1F|nr:TetR family transcriptional regulator [Salsipaludibacter albus]MBY5162452.1 TetR family transcriptional regulator [Salsipaludibacter albus]
MSSASASATRSDRSDPGAGDPAGPASTGTDEDRTARARIRDAALHLFGERGVKATTVRAIARDAGVSPALVVHHFGSKQGLRDAVDEYVLAEIRAGKYAAMTEGMAPTDTAYEDLARDKASEMAYLVRALTDDSEVGRQLYQRLFDDAVDYLAAGMEAGVLHPSDDPEAHAAVLLNAGLAQMLLQPHTQRALGADDHVDMLMRIAPVMLDLYTDGLFTDDRFRVAWRTEADHAARTTDPDPPQTPAPHSPRVE